MLRTTRRPDNTASSAESDRTARQHGQGKLTARERVLTLLDEDSFLEQDRYLTHQRAEEDVHKVPGDGVITGTGTIDGRTVCVIAQDFTVYGGTVSGVSAAKICRLMDLATRTGVPIVSLNDSGGGRIQDGVDALSGYTEIFRRHVTASGLVPQISAALGPCTGGAAYSAALTDFVFMAGPKPAMLVCGAAVTRAATGEDVPPDALGGANVHRSLSGVAHFTMPDEFSCLDQIGHLLSFLPANCHEDPPRCPSRDDPHRLTPEVDALVPRDSRKAYDVRRLIRCVVDDGILLEVHEAFARNVVVGFGRLDGRPVGFFANQPAHLAGSLDIDASAKASRFVQFCDCFNLPIVTLVDTPGFLPGRAQENGGILRYGARLLAAVAEATVPKVTIITRKAFGGGYAVMASKQLGSDLNYAFPGAEIAVMGPDAALNTIFRRELAAYEEAHARERARQRIESAYREEFLHPYHAAARGYVDGVVAPREARRVLTSSLRVLRDKRSARSTRKHGNYPT